MPLSSGERVPLPAPLGGRRFCRVENLIFFDTLPSTNDWAKKLVESSMAEDNELLVTGVVARHQTRGRGRSDRPWISFPGTALALSLIVPWPEGPGRIRVPVESGIVLARGLTERYRLDVRLKWPNDLLVARQKLGGILVEARAGADGTGFAVIGVGLNLSTTRRALDEAGLTEATSLSLQGVPEGEVEGDGPLIALLSILDASLKEPLGDLAEAFAAVSAHRAGDAISVAQGGRTVEGTYRGVTRDGLLRLGTPAGEETLVSGEIVSF